MKESQEKAEREPANLVSGIFAQEIILSSLVTLLVRQGAINFETLDTLTQHIATQEGLTEILPDLTADISRVLSNARAAAKATQGD